jgi:hypothetical protein
MCAKRHQLSLNNAIARYNIDRDSAKPLLGADVPTLEVATLLGRTHCSWEYLDY